MTEFTRLAKQPEAMDWEEADGIGIRYAVFEADSYVPQHSHSYEHVSSIPFGEGTIQRDGDEPKPFKGPCFIVIPAHAKHLFHFTTRGMLMCIHNTSRSGSIEVEEEHQIVGDS
jgi:quercetin dioxygenase-like cupin family protein